MKLNPTKTKYMVVSQSRIIAPSYCDLTLGGAELEEGKSLVILNVPLDFRLTFETHLREVGSMAVKSLDSLADQETYLIVHVFSRVVSIHMFCST